MHALRRAPAAPARRLLRVLLVRLGEVPAGAAPALLLLALMRMQPPARTGVEGIAKELLALFPQLDDVGRTIALALYRQLAEGAPVPLGALAARLQISSDAVGEQMRAWPGVYYDGHRRVIGFQGLTIAPMAHRLRVEGRELYAWCAWDTLFLPELVGATMHVESTCRATGHAIHLTVTPQALESAAPPETVISFLIPQSAEIKKDVITSFCHYVHFFSATQAARGWLAQRPDAFLLGVTDAYKLGRRINEARYGDRLRDLRAREAPSTR